MLALPRRYDLLRKRLDQFTRMLHGVEAGNARALHRTRVASRRLRELLPVLQLDCAATGKLGRRLRKVTQRLGAVRELDMLLLLIDELHESGRHDERGLGRIAEAVARDRDKRRQRLLEKPTTVELRRIGDKLSELARKLDEEDRGRQPARGWRWALEARVARRASRLKGAIEAAGAVYLPERLHVVRIALKKLRYGVELSAEAASTPRHPDLRALKRGQDLLGRLQDLQVLIGRVRQVQASLTPPDVTAWHQLDLLVAWLENSCRRLHGRYMRERAALVAICDRVGARPPARRVVGRAG